MLRFAANLSMMYAEHPFLERFARAAEDGFTGVEFLFPYAYAPEQLRKELDRHGLQQALFNAPPGDWSSGERGIACLPGRETEFRRSFHEALRYAEALRCRRIHVMAGICAAGLDRPRALDTLRANLAWALEAAGDAGPDLLLEPINLRDMPGYLLNRQEEAHAIARSLNHPRLKVQMDLYHCQIMEGDILWRLRRHLGEGSRVGHIQIAGVPDRHEPGEGELNYDSIFRVIEEMGYAGWIGCEYRPRGGTSEGLQWLRRYRLGRAQ